jgi:phage tail sheath protein FI
MKYTIMAALVMLHIITIAQQKQLLLKDSPAIKSSIKTNVLYKKNAAPVPVEVTIENELKKIVAAYADQPNNTTTWAQITAAAENLLYPYFRDGKLLGIKKEQAYYIMMGTTTMTATDIANKKMILIAGIAPNKPAEFIIIKVIKNGN